MAIIESTDLFLLNKLFYFDVEIDVNVLLNILMALLLCDVSVMA